MATVYMGFAEREDGTEEHVALKVIRDELAHDEQFATMFIDEAKILARLSHPNVIHTLEYGVTGHHRFIAMELLSGRTLYDVWELLVSQGERLTPPLAAFICARTAEGLHSAHELVDDTGAPLSVIHRDVNPGNIFLTYAGEVKLIDFGLAKARVRLSKSAEGIVKGKIPYLAPEQASGRPIDRRIDVYALGTTLWESVTMKRLFKRDNDVDTLRAIREAKVPDVREMIEGFPDEVWDIIRRALAIDPDERFPTTAAMQEALDAFAGDRAARQADLVALLARLFPGQQARQARWERAASRPTPMYTMPPPVPVPTASSSMLEAAEAVASDSVPSAPKARVVVTPEPEAPGDVTAAEEAPPAKASAAVAGETADAVPAPAPEPSAPASARPSEPPPKKKSKKGKKRRDKDRSRTGPAKAGSRAGASEATRDDRDEERGARSKRRRDDRSSRRATPEEATPATPPKRRMWITAAIAVGVALTLWLAFSAR